MSDEFRECGGMREFIEANVPGAKEAWTLEELEEKLAALTDRVTLLELALGDDSLKERLNARAALIDATRGVTTLEYGQHVHATAEDEDDGA